MSDKQKKDSKKHYKKLVQWFEYYESIGSPKRLDGALKRDLFSIHNDIFTARETNQSCPSCVSRVFRRCKYIYDNG